MQLTLNSTLLLSPLRQEFSVRKKREIRIGAVVLRSSERRHTWSRKGTPTITIVHPKLFDNLTLPIEVESQTQTIQLAVNRLVEQIILRVV